MKIQRSLVRAFILAMFSLPALAQAQSGYNRDGTPTAAITEEQKVATVGLFVLPDKVPPPHTEVAAQIAPVASTVLQQLACGATWRRLSQLGGSDRIRNQNIIKPHPFDRARYHPKDVCMNVTELSEWDAPAANAISFLATFVSPESEEQTRMRFEFTRSTRGDWLVTRVQAVW